MANTPGLEKYNLLLLLQSFRLWISTITAPNTSPLCRHHTRTFLLISEVPGKRGGINEGCKFLIYWVYRRCPLKSLLERSWRHLYGPRFCNVTDFYHYAMHPRKNIYTPLMGALQNVSNRAPHLLTPALISLP